MTLGIFLYSTKRLQRMGATHHRQNMKLCNRKTVETLKHWLSNSSTDSRLFLHKSQCMSPHIYNIGMYTSPSWWTYQNTLFHLKLTQDWFPPTSKDIWETCIKYLHKHTRIHLHFKHCHKCQSDSSPGQSTPSVYVRLLVFTPKSPVNLSPREPVLYHQLPTEMATRGTPHPPGSPAWPQPTGACSEPLGTGITEEWWVWSQVPLLVSSNINKYVNHCKSVNNCQMGNERHIICKITITGPTQAFCFRDCCTPTPNYLKCTLLVAILVTEQLFWCWENKRLG